MMPERKILLIANTDWYLYNFRLSLAKHLRNQGFEVVFVSPKGDYVEEIIKNRFRFFEWNIGRKSTSLIQEIKSIAQLKRIYTLEKPDLVHHFTIKPVIYGSISARISGISGIVNSITGLGYIFLTKEIKGKFLRAIVFPLYRVALTGPKIINIFENKFDQEIFIKHNFVNRNNSTIINGVGVDEQYFLPTPDPELEIPLVVLPARMLYDKGVKTLVDAARILKSKTNLRVALVGDVDPGNPSSIEVSTLKKWEKEGLAEWWGFQKNMREIYQNSTIVTLPSLGEGLPTVLIEAAACGRPIVATDVAGCREVVQDQKNGFLVPPKDPEALAEALLVLINDPEMRSRMGNAGRALVLEKFTDKKINTETLAIYEKLLN